MTFNTYDFDGKTVIVTGAGSGMGREIALGFLQNGANVVLTGRREEPLRETVELSGASNRTLVVAGDIADRAHIVALLDAAEERFGGVDVVVSNAGAFAGGDITELDEDAWVRLRETNIDGFMRLVAEALPRLEARGGNLVAVTSASGLGGDWGQAAYNATKHAVVGFVRSLALDWGGRGVRINAIAPSFTQTDMTSMVSESPAALRAFENRIALGRPGRADDMVGPVMFLASPDAAYVTGAVLPVDGGTSASNGQPHVE